MASREFAHADRISRFLRFVVERTLQADRESLKESVIGTAVYGRAPGYDPKAEPIVRTEARRLRAKLADYYQASGRDDRIHISVPVGAYVAAFDYRTAPAAPRLAVLPRPAPPAPAASKGKLWWAWRVGTILCVLATSGALTIWRLGDVRTHREFVLTTLTSYPGAQHSPVISPDGRQIAFAWSEDRGGNDDLYVAGVDGGAPKRLTTAHAADTFPAWSPDGAEIAFIRADRLVVVSPSGGGERVLGPAYPSWVSWSPDRKTILLTDWIPGRHAFAQFALDESTGSRRQVTFPPAGITGDLASSLSSDGRLAFIRCQTQANCDIYTASYGRDDTRRLTHDECSFAGLSWMPDGRGIFYSSRRRGPYMLWLVSASGGTPEQLAASGDDDRYPRTARGPSGKARVVFAHRIDVGNIWRQQLGPKSAPPERLTATTRLDSSPQVSSDGTRIVFVSDRTGYDEIWASEADGSISHALTHLHGLAGSPRWSPDGARIAFDLLGKNGRAIFLTDVNGSAPQQWTPFGTASRPSWSRDGHWIYFGADDAGGRQQVWKISTAPDRTIVQVTHDGGFEAYESRDGQTLFYTRGGSELRRIAVAGGPETRVTSRPVRHGWWGVADNGIYFAELPEPKSSIYDEPFPVFQLNPESGQIRQVASVKGPVNRSTPDFAISADGRTLYYCPLEMFTSQVRMLEAL